MNMKNKFVVMAVCLAGISVSIASGQVTSFSDNFEGPALNSFWSISTAAGSVTFPSTTQAHSGNQSIQFNTTYYTGQKNIWLYHNYSVPDYGQASVWVYDTGAGVSSANYLYLILQNQVTGSFISLHTQDYDLGPANGGCYYFSLADGSDHNTTVVRSQAWHQFLITSLPGALTISIDGTPVYTGNAGMQFDQIRLQMSGPTWRPAWVSYWDDFSTSPVPEPSTLSFLALAAIALAACKPGRRLSGILNGHGRR
jgi:hypothetical protein